MSDSTVSADLETDLDVALHVGFTYTAHDAFLLPRGLDDVIDQFRSGHSPAGDVLGQERAALGRIVALDVFGIRVDVFVAVSDFHFVHFFSLLNFDGLDYNTFAGSDSRADLRLLRLFGLACFEFFFDASCFDFQRVEICVLVIQFYRDRGQSLFELLNSHFFQFHVQTSVKIRILCFWRSRFSRSSRSAFSASITPSK